MFGVDGLGRDVTHGYGSLMVPTQPGVYERYVDMYAPVPSSWAQRFLNWLRGTYPEFYTMDFVAKGNDL